MKILIFGKGFIGTACKEIWGDEAILSDVRITSKEDVAAEIARHQPDAVLNAAGVVGKPNVDWCDTHQFETIAGNVVLPVMIAEACQEAGVYLLHIGSGCVYYGKSSHPDGAWRENDPGNPEPVYTRCKLAADLVLSTLPNVGIGRIRMPIHNRPHPANLIDKLARYDRVIDVENSVTIVEDMAAAFYALMEQRGTGIFHVTNPGTFKHREILGLYEEFVDPTHTNTWITEEELVQQGLAGKLRSTNTLNSDRLIALGIHIRPIDVAMRDTMQKYGVAKNGG